MNKSFWLRHSGLLVQRLRYAAWERTHPSAPWLCPGTVEFLDRHLERGMRVLEFGSGRSTQWFAERVQSVVSVEYDDAWYRRVATQISRRNLTNVDLRYIALEHPHSAPEQPSYDPLPRYVRVVDEFTDSFFGAVLIDGHYRTNCVRQVLSKIAHGGYLIVDDAQRWSDHASLGIPGEWSLVDESTNVLKSTLIWQSPLTRPHHVTRRSSLAGRPAVVEEGQ